MSYRWKYFRKKHQIWSKIAKIGVDISFQPLVPFKNKKHEQHLMRKLKFHCSTAKPLCFDTISSKVVQFLLRSSIKSILYCKNALLIKNNNSFIHCFFLGKKFHLMLTRFTFLSAFRICDWPTGRGWSLKRNGLVPVYKSLLFLLSVEKNSREKIRFSSRSLFHIPILPLTRRIACRIVGVLDNTYVWGVTVATKPSSNPVVCHFLNMSFDDH